MKPFLSRKGLREVFLSRKGLREVFLSRKGLRETLGPRARLVLGLSLSLSAVRDADAESPSVTLVRNLTPSRSARPHPLADDTGRIPFMVHLGGGEVPPGLRELAPGWYGARLDPLGLLALADEHPELDLWVTPNARPTLDQVGRHLHVESYRERTGGTGEGVVVGVVDTGLDVTHAAFRNPDGSTRVAWMLTWAKPRGVHPELEERFGCTDPNQAPCAIWSAADLDEVLLSGDLPDDLRDRSGHGTHVTSIAGGNGQRFGGGFSKQVGVAPDATLIFAAPSETGGFGDADVFRGLDFIFERAESEGMPAVANLSLGGEFGPHDGTSPLEAGTAGFAGPQFPGRLIVAAAGNSGGVFEAGEVSLGTHSSVAVREHAPAEVSLVTPDAGGEVFIWITFREGDDVSVGLEGPDGMWISLQDPGEEAGYEDDGANATVINNLENSHSTITSETNSAVVAFDGTWPEGGRFRVHLEGSGDAELWATGGYFERATKAGTINLPASHPDIIAVGCTVNRLSWTSIDGEIEIEPDAYYRVDEPCDFSGQGPTPNGTPKPDLSAPGALVGAAMGLDVDPRGNPDSLFSSEGCPEETSCYVLSEDYAIASGTSMSSPVVAGAAALLLGQDPSLTQARAKALLKASARRPRSARADGPQVGAGLVDLRSLDVALLPPPEEADVPDRAESFWMLSADRARADGVFPVTGTIQLRRAGGLLASGVDAARLGVEVTGGVVLSAPTNVAHGLFEFQVAGVGSGELTVAVTLDGEPLGSAMVLPKSPDPWDDESKSAALGGLQCGASPGAPAAPSRGFSAALGLGMLGALARFGRRRRRPSAAPAKTR